jgi:hypothetical protein
MVVFGSVIADSALYGGSYRPSNSTLRCASTTPQDYPEWSGFGRRREREWVHRGTGRGTNQENPPMRIYIIGDGHDLSDCGEKADCLTVAA